MERIFRAMVTSDDQKVRLATHMLAEKAEYWWTNAKGRLETGGEVVTWARFKSEFLRKYFPEDLRTRKEVEFLNLKQDNLSVAEYAAKFEKLSRFCPYINVEDALVSKCVKFESGLRPEIYQYMCVQEIRDFDNLVVTPLLGGMVIDTPTSGSVTTSLMCAKCPVNFGNFDFELDLCLPLKHMDVIFGMDWMLSFGVNINCLTKSVTFSKKVEEVSVRFLTAEQVKKSLDGEASVFMMFASLEESSEKGIGDLPVVQDVGYLYWLHYCENKYPCLCCWNQCSNMSLGISVRCWIRCSNILSRFSVPGFMPICTCALYCLRKQYFLILLTKQRAYLYRISCGIFLK